MRIAHFHECLQQLDTAWIEGRVRSAIRGYQLAVVPDAERAHILANQLALSARPMVVPNFPMRDHTTAAAARTRDAREPFTVIYCGSLGVQQKLDLVIRSIPEWPAHARFAIVGNANSTEGEKLRAIAREVGVDTRVDFEGWLDYAHVPARLARADLAIALLDPAFEQWRTALGASNKRYEYMRAGLPQIGDMNPGVGEMLEGQGIGRCLGAFTTAELAAIVTDYADDPSRCRAEGEKAYRLHLEKYNYPSAFQPVLDWISAHPPSRESAGRAAARPSARPDAA